MERPPKIDMAESELVKKYDLAPGRKVAFEKVALHTNSDVPAGATQEGTLLDAVELSKPIRFTDSEAVISDVQRIYEEKGQLHIATRTSVYRLIPETNEQTPESFEWQDIQEVETANGSVYRYLPDGRTQRFKKVENRDYAPQNALVYVPDYAWVKENAPPEALEKLGENEAMYIQTLLEYVQNPHKKEKKVYIVDQNGNRIETNQQILDTEGTIFLTFLSGKTTVFDIPVTHKPKIGFMTYDTRKYTDADTGESNRVKHLGNKVVRIALKEASS